MAGSTGRGEGRLVPTAGRGVATVRMAGPADVGAVVELVESAYRGEASRAGWTTEADLLDGQRTDAAEVVAAISADYSEVLLLEVPGAPGGPETVGCCHVEMGEPGLAWFGLFAVRPVGQGAGHGSSLLTEAGRVAAAWGCGELRLLVIRQRLDLIDWYHRRGFRPTGETKPFPYGDERFGRPRRDDLEFAVLAAPL